MSTKEKLVELLRHYSDEYTNPTEEIADAILNLFSVRQRALNWWDKLPEHGGKDSTFDECRFKTKGGLTNIYHEGRFCTDLTDDEIQTIYELHAEQLEQQREHLINFLSWHDAENLGCLPEGINGRVDEYLKLVKEGNKSACPLCDGSGRRVFPNCTPPIDEPCPACKR